MSLTLYIFKDIAFHMHLQLFICTGSDLERFMPLLDIGG